MIPDEMLQKAEPGTIAVVGVPIDDNSSFMQGPAQAPPKIREVLTNGAANLCAERGIDLGIEKRLRFVADMDLPAGPAAMDTIAADAAQLLARGAKILALGGDHSLTYPLLRAYHNAGHHLTILHLDAHPDLYDTLDGNRYSHACPFARIMEDGLARQLIQVGIRTATPHQREQATKFGVRMIDMQRWRADLALELSGPLYLSLDLDVLDPAFAPGVSHHEPGGLSMRELLTLIQRIRVPVLGADIVEYNPKRDVNDLTAMVAAKLLKEIAALMLLHP